MKYLKKKMKNNLGKNIILCGPSGSGKSTIINYLLNKLPILSFSISCTTRIPRYNEIHGKDYYFISRNSFSKNIKMNNFFEWQQVYYNIFYGTLKKEVEKIWQKQKYIIFDIDVKGALNIKKQYPNNTLTIFIKTTSKIELQYRLLSRSTESIQNIRQRMKKINFELAYAHLFDYIILNDDLILCKKKIENQILSFLNL